MQAINFTSISFSVCDVLFAMVSFFFPKLLRNECFSLWVRLLILLTSWSFHMFHEIGIMPSKFCSENYLMLVFFFFLVFFFVLWLLKETSLPKSKYEEDVYINNHTSVWGSWWKDHQWGYKCCKQTIRNSYCTGSAGIEAAEAAADLMKANIDRKVASEGQ